MAHLKPILIVLCLFMLSACSTGQTKNDGGMSLLKTVNPKPIVTAKSENQESAAAIKKDVNSVPHIYDAAVVKGKKNALVVYKVKHLYRFKMKKIEKQITELLEKKYPNEKFTVSSDYKIFLEAIRLKNRIKEDNKFSEQEAEKQLKKIIKMTEAMT